MRRSTEAEERWEVIEKIRSISLERVIEGLISSEFSYGHDRDLDKFIKTVSKRIPEFGLVESEAEKVWAVVQVDDALNWFISNYCKPITKDQVKVDKWHIKEGAVLKCSHPRIGEVYISYLYDGDEGKGRFNYDYFLTKSEEEARKYFERKIKPMLR